MTANPDRHDPVARAFAVLRDDPLAADLRALAPAAAARLEAALSRRNPPPRLVDFLTETGAALWSQASGVLASFALAGERARAEVAAFFDQLAFRTSAHGRLGHYGADDEETILAQVYPADPEQAPFKAALSVRSLFFRAEGELCAVLHLDAQVAARVPGLARGQMVLKVVDGARAKSSHVVPIRAQAGTDGSLELGFAIECPPHRAGNGLSGLGVALPVRWVRLFLFEG